MSIKIVVFDLGNVIFRFDLSKFIKAYPKKTRNYKVKDFNELIFACSDVLRIPAKEEVFHLSFIFIIFKKALSRRFFSF
jgi:FMN phosphatase YigB (HAD superfamily)